MRAETKHSMLRRCNGWDYRQPCIYQITLVLADRRSQALGGLKLPLQAPHLGLPPQAQNQPPQAQATGGGAVPSAEAIGRALALAASAEIALTPAGEAVRREFWALGEHHPEIKPLEIAVMPDHVHFIIRVLRPMAKPLGQAIAGFKTGSSKAAIGTGGLWAEGFQDTILFHDGQLAAMFNYLRDNARRLAIKRLLPDLFRVRRGFSLKLQSMPTGSVPAAAAAGITAYFSAIGNHFLLESPNLLQVQCSRSYFAYRRIPKTQSCRSEHRTSGLKIARNEKGEPIIEKATPEFEAKRDMLLAAAKHGAVLISPCISDGEREIARLAFAAGLPVVALRNMGFSPLYKPGGKLFAQTSGGKLLLLAPAAWPYQTSEKRMTRFDACALNRIAQLIAGDGAAEINYHGMKPNDIDRLVREAVKGDPDGQ